MKTEQKWKICDCLEGLPEIPDEQVDLIMTDLPYGTTACSWDVVIPFEPLWEQYTRIIKDSGVIVLTSSQPFTSLLINSNLKMFREELCWLKNKSGSGFQKEQKHIKIHENVCIFSKNGKYTFNPQKWKVEDRKFLTQRKTLSIYGKGNTIYSPTEMQRKNDDGTRYPISVIAYSVPHTPSNTKSYNEKVDLRFHPTQKPVKLIEYLIKTYSNEGDLVHDSCLGSGTTLEACMNLNRNCIGFEIDPQWEPIYRKRLKLDNIKLDEFNIPVIQLCEQTTGGMIAQQGKT